MNNLSNNKLSHIFNLPNLNFKTQMNISIDSNVHIKSIINIQSYLFDIETDTVNSKCNIKGKVGVKILYIDIDNVYNTITDELSFAETVSDQSITSDVKVVLFNEQITPSVDFDDNYLKLNLNINAKLMCDIDLGFNQCSTDQPNLVVKKQPVHASCCVEYINNKSSDECSIRLPNRASKILNINITPTLNKVECNNGYISLAGTSLTQIIYDVDLDNSCELKSHTESFPFKFESQASLSETDCLANIITKLNNSTLSFTTDLDEDQTSIKIEYEMIIKGFIFKPEMYEFVDDLYCLDSDIEPSFAERDICLMSPMISYQTNIDGELQLKEEILVDEIISCVNHSCLITQTYYENKALIIEGMMSSTLIYLNEQKEVKSMQTELPFSISKEYDSELECDMLNFEITPISCKTKIKRGNLLTLDYETNVHGYTSQKMHSKILENIKLGKTIEYGDIAFQILVAKSNETLWEFCKRAHTTESQIRDYNKEIPPVFQGGEKVIIYR